tara:strand:- start:133 stop:798 length:666 start_codon:yes stop_codon:yes gene_type:complete
MSAADKLAVQIEQAKKRNTGILYEHPKQGTFYLGGASVIAGKGATNQVSLPRSYLTDGSRRRLLFHLVVQILTIAFLVVQGAQSKRHLHLNVVTLVSGASVAMHCMSFGMLVLLSWRVEFPSDYTLTTALISTGYLFSLACTIILFTLSFRSTDEFLSDQGWGYVALACQCFSISLCLSFANNLAARGGRVHITPDFHALNAPRSEQREIPSYVLGSLQAS